MTREQAAAIAGLGRCSYLIPIGHGREMSDWRTNGHSKGCGCAECCADAAEVFQARQAARELARRCEEEEWIPHSESSPPA
jgi:hypothetical protein